MTKKNAIVLIQKNSLSYFTDGMSNALVFPFPSELVKDFEIVNPDVFKQQLQTFLMSQKIPPSEIALIYAGDTLFFKTFQGILKNNVKENADVNEFLETVPFEHVIHLEVETNKNVTMYATNEEFYIISKRLFEKLKSTIEYVSILQITNLTILSSQISKDQATALLQKFSIYKQHNMLKKDELTLPTNKSVVSVPQPTGKKQKKRVFVLSAVFFVLIIILSIMLWSTFNQPSLAPKKQAIVVPLTTTPSKSVSPTITTATPAASLEPDQINIQLNSNQKSATDAAAVKTKLIQDGFTKITEQQGQGTSGTILAMFSADLPQSTQDLILKDLNTIPSNVVVTKNSTIKNSVIITF